MSPPVNISLEASGGSHHNYALHDRNWRGLSATAPPALVEPMGQRQVLNPPTPLVKAPPRGALSLPAALVCSSYVGHDDPPSSAREDCSKHARCDQGREDQKHLMMEYDAKGYCVHHPQVRLRKKKVLGGH